MGFKLGTITYGKQGHKWTNDPDVCHQKCVTCGCRKDSIYRNAKGGRDYTYYDYNGNKVEELPECRSVYDLLNEDD